MTHHPCPHCGVVLPETDVASRRCSACGKVITRRTPDPARQIKQQKMWALMGWIIFGLIAGVGLFVACRLILDFPSSKDYIIPFLIGMPVGCSILFGCVFGYFSKRQPGVIKGGLYLVLIISILLGVLALVFGVISVFFK